MIEPSGLRAIFVDRDGVINRERQDYVKSWREFVFLPGALAALARLARLRVPVLVITNQSAIGRAHVSATDVATIHMQMQTVVNQAGGRIDHVYLCPHHPDEGCTCRKPAPGLLIQAMRDYGLDLKRCVFIGDSVTDAVAADAAGCRALLVRTGRQGNHLPALIATAREQETITQRPLPICDDLTAAATRLAQEWMNLDPKPATISVRSLTDPSPLK